MSSQKYERVSLQRRNDRTAGLGEIYIPHTYEIGLQVSANDEDENPVSPPSSPRNEPTPNSPPPSFRSRASSPLSRHLLSTQDPVASEAERTLADTFDDGSDSDDEDNNNGDDRQRLMRANTVQSDTDQRVVHDGDRPSFPGIITRRPGTVSAVATSVPVRPNTGGAPYSSFAQNDGVFANLNAKPERGEKLEEQPPVSQTSSVYFLSRFTDLV